MFVKVQRNIKFDLIENLNIYQIKVQNFSQKLKGLESNFVFGIKINLIMSIAMCFLHLNIRAKSQSDSYL